MNKASLASYMFEWVGENLEEERELLKGLRPLLPVLWVSFFLFLLRTGFALRPLGSGLRRLVTWVN